MTSSPNRAVAGALRWWMPLLGLAVGTAALVFAAWAAGVDMHAAGERMLDRLDETFNHSSYEIHDERGRLEVEYGRDDSIRRVRHDGTLLPPADIVLEDNYLTVTSLKYDDGELMYWRIPLDWTDELREELRNPRWRMLLRAHPRAADEPPGLRVGRVGEKGAAGRADVRVGDVIVAVDDQRPATSAELEAALQLAITERATGGVVALLIERGGAEQVVPVELEPLLSKAEWDALPRGDAEQRWLLYKMPWRRDEYDRDHGAPAVSATQESSEPGAMDAIEPIQPLPPPEPPHG